MNILYLGDIMARPGREIIARHLPGLRKKLRATCVIAQAENVSHGKSMTPAHMRELQAVGVDFFTGGNHTIERKALHSLLADPLQPVICPANMPSVPTEWGAKTLPTPAGDVLAISILGDTFPNSLPIANPLKAFDETFGRYDPGEFAAIIVNFHGDYSSQKKIFGNYVDGRVSLVIGDHWHIQTADAEILPGGSAYQTDAGMCGTIHSSLGIAYDPLLARWRDGAKTAAEVEEAGPFQINGLLVKVDPATRRAKTIRTIRETYPGI